MKKLLTTQLSESILAKNEHLMRHHKVCAHLHYSVCTTLGIETADKWRTRAHTQARTRPVYEPEDVNML